MANDPPFRAGFLAEELMKARFSTLSGQSREQLLYAWLGACRPSWTSADPAADLTTLTPRLREFLDAMLSLLDEDLLDPTATIPSADHPALPRLRELIALQARLGVTASATAALLTTLKGLLAEALIPAAGDPSARQALEALFDRLLPVVFDAYVEHRERLITQQSLSLLELSTPVLRVWHRILLMPLVGVVDTARARQFTERLLDGVARYEALVTIIDVTGVPVLDTSVAQHLMKTIDAARLLGTRIVMTGISPEGAQTLTKLGIRFSDVVSRASLRAGIAEALAMVGQRIVVAPPRDETRS